jgi:hypothetical protein
MFFVDRLLDLNFPRFPREIANPLNTKETDPNVVNAGFTKSIGATPDDLNVAVSLFFISFVLLQPPSAAVGRWLGARHWITIMMASSILQPLH